MRSHAQRLRCLAIAAALFGTDHANAEPKDSEIKEAKQQFAKGLAAAGVGNHEAARVAFKIAYNLKATPYVAFNLGGAEFQTGHWVDAARHLSASLRSDVLEPRFRQVAEATLRKAEAHVARLFVTVDASGADIDIDGQWVGLSPLPEQPIYTESGMRTARARKDGYREAKRTEKVEDGGSYTLQLSLAPFDEAVAPSLPPSSAMAKGETAEPSPPAREAALAGVTEKPAVSEKVEASGPSTRTIVLGIGVGATVVSFGVAAIFAAKRESDSSAALALQQQIRDQRGSCRPGPSAGCAELLDRWEARDSAGATANVALVIGGVLAGGTIAGLLLWPKTTRPSISLQSSVSASRAVFHLEGEF